MHADPLSSFFADHPNKQRKENVAFCMPRQPTSLFGVSILGAHLIGEPGAQIGGTGMRLADICACSV